MTRIAYDCTGANAHWVRSNLPLPAVMFYYDTGSSDIDWTAEQRALFPADILVAIDQGGAGSPATGRRILDVENGAWSPAVATDAASGNPAIIALYGSRDTLAQCAAAGYRGDFWLAWPGWTGDALPSYPGITIVAVQDDWQQDYDKSTLLADSWPFGTSATPLAGDFKCAVHSRASVISLTTVAAADHYTVNYTPASGGPPRKIWTERAVQDGIKFITAPLTIPDAAGGQLTAFGIVNGKGVIIGTVKLP